MWREDFPLRRQNSLSGPRAKHRGSVAGKVSKRKMRSLRKCLDSSINAVFTLVEPLQPPPLPPIRNQLLLEPATELAKRIALGEIKSVDVVSAYIERITEVNRLINAVVDERFKEALEESQLVDDLIARSDESQRHEILRRKPFLGVPITTKNLVGVKGMLIDVGLLSRRGVRSERDAGAIEMMRKAGAIPLAITNVSEMAMWWESNNKVHGRTRNPYDLRRNAGGSSGGEGSLLASAGSVIGIGTDIGGSIRMPAFFNGIYGHKPSPHIVPNTGQYPEIVDVQAEFLGTGPMCRYARDLRPMMIALAGEDNSKLLKLGENVDIRKIKVYFMREIKDRSFLISPVCSEVRRALQDVVDHLATLSSRPAEEKYFASLSYAFEIWNHLMMSGDCPKFIDVLKESGSSIGNPVLEVLKWGTGQSKHTLPAVCLAVGEKFLPPKESETSRRFVEMGIQLQEEFHGLLNNNDAVFLCPTHPEPAPKHRTPIFKGFNFSYTGIFNVLKVPVTACHVRLGENSGLPVGIQVVAGQNQDRLCLAVAEEIERTFGGWQDPSGKS